MITIEVILLLISLVCFILYNVFVLMDFGLPESISATSYLFKEKYNKHWLFSILCGIIVVGLFPLWVTLSVESYQFLVFLTCAGILFAGCTPLFREDLQKYVHYTSGIIAFISVVIWLIVCGHVLSIINIMLLCLALLSLFGFKYYVYFGEVVAYLMLIVILLL